MGGIFVVEALSVMLQVTWFKYTKKKYGAGTNQPGIYKISGSLRDLGAEVKPPN